MRSFIFCTSFVQGGAGDCSSERWRRWIDYYSPRKELFGAERVFLIDDATPLERVPPGVSIVSSDEPLPDRLPDGPVMLRFREHYGRASLRAFPGWWRSFTFSSQVARKYSYRKIIHCESDAFVVSRRMAEHMRSLGVGWTVFWCPRHGIPETSIQVLCDDSINTLEKLHRLGERLWFQRSWRARVRAQLMRLKPRRRPGQLAGFLLAPLMPQTAELVLPFDEVSRSFVGDRYGEYGDDYPESADYVCQSTAAMRFDHRLAPGDIV